MAFKPSERRSDPTQSTELNTTPIMNLMVVLIPLLLAGAKFTELALLEYLPPADAGSGSQSDTLTVDPPVEPGAEEELGLLVNILDTGIQVSIFGETETGPHCYEIPFTMKGGYDWLRLNDSLKSIKINVVGPPTGKRRVFDEADSTWKDIDAYKYVDASEVAIAALQNITFQTVVNTLDACQSYKVEEQVNGQKRIVEKELFPQTALSQFQTYVFATETE